jgi:FHA domain
VVTAAHFATAVEELDWKEYRGNAGPYRTFTTAAPTTAPPQLPAAEPPMTETTTLASSASQSPAPIRPNAKHRRHNVSQIEVRADGEPVAVHSFPVGRAIVGRSPENDIYIRSKFVSRHHAQLISDEEGCLIEDLNSTNGVFIDDKQVRRYRLQDGDIVSLGIHQLVYRDLREIAEESADDDATAVN